MTPLEHIRLEDMLKKKDARVEELTDTLIELQKKILVLLEAVIELASPPPPVVLSSVESMEKDPDPEGKEGGERVCSVVRCRSCGYTKTIAVLPLDLDLAILAWCPACNIERLFESAEGGKTPDSKKKG